MHRLELIILKNLIHNEEYTRKVLPFLKAEYFSDLHERHVYEEIVKFTEKYKNPPTHESLVINFTEATALKEEEVKEAIGILSEIQAAKDQATDNPWLVDNTEKFCQDKAIYNAVLQAVSILDGNDKKNSKGMIPELLSQALSISFDNHVGHDYLEASDERFDFYHRKEEKIPFDIEVLNRITKGGFSKKTLNVIIAAINVGKSLILCHIAASYLLRAKNVLYITLEMAEERIAERIDANLLGIPIDDIVNIPKAEFDRRVAALRTKTTGKLIVKEYPTASASTLHFKSLLNELALKKNFRPDAIFVDYINICSSARIKVGSQTNSYQLVKSIAEELRGLAVEFNVPVISATQFTRGGMEDSDPDMTDTSESIGLPQTVDWMAAVMEPEDMITLNQYLWKQLKSRYGDKNINRKFVTGVDKKRMKIYDVEESAQPNNDVPPAPPVQAKAAGKPKYVLKKFEGFKI